MYKVFNVFIIVTWKQQRWIEGDPGLKLTTSQTTSTQNTAAAKSAERFTYIYLFNRWLAIKYYVNVS